MSDTPRRSNLSPPNKYLIHHMDSSQHHAVSPHEPAPADRTGQKRPAPRGSASYPRKRAVTACQVCRARRTKCDNAKPACTFCVKVGAKCIQAPVDLSSFDPASLQILQRLDDLEQVVRDVGSGNATSKQAFEPAQMDAKLDRSQLLPCSINAILEWQPLKRLTVGREVQGPAFPCTNRSALQMTGSPPISGLDEFEPHRIKLLLDNFFNYVHVKNPILDEQKTRRTVNRVCMHGIDWSPDACLALLVCALGTIATPLDGGYIRSDSEAYRTAESFFLAAKKRLGLILGTSSLVEAQCMFFAGVYSMCTFDRMPAWRYFMQSLACCQTFQSLIAFTQDYGEQLDEAGRRSAAAEQAIYWSAWKSEREVNDDLNLPGFLFSEIDIAGYPPFFPTPPNHQDEVQRLLNAEAETREQMSWYFYLSEISLLRLWRRMAKEIMEFAPGPGQDHILGLAQGVPGRESQIMDWIRALPGNMSTQAPVEEDEICRFVLRGHLINVWEILYWPFVNRAIQSGLYGDISPVVQQLASKGLQIHVDRVDVNRPGFSHRHHGTFGMIKSCTRSALILLAAASSFTAYRHEQAPVRELACDLPSGWQRSVEDVIQLLEAWVHEAADLSTILAVLRQLYHDCPART
ncbi:hypothetical protein C7974DRAFT_441275 [Boeremia exigua]|uniref:uncharacterized protein n=1 Tax=Boeremia exigua TaxID=749465 RepID=UPI001E8CFCDD|nr:uncharacterized protein C7974DRAFT_441275 [Boeremia exigua]KAH6618790.1 hypothetical protein C7974DRAFT_441275 [Boeremia exigua]